MKSYFVQEVTYHRPFPKRHLERENAIYFVDSFFKNRFFFKNKSRVYFIDAGEEAKSFKTYKKNIEYLNKSAANRKTTIYSLGGGTLGDSIGFLASTYMRGLDHIHVPTTWLAALDSSIGGKTALNFGNHKNQIGSFYIPEQTLICLELLKTASFSEAEGEIVKTLFLNLNKKWAQELLRKWEKKKELKLSDIKNLIEYKKSIVKKDFYDEKGLRAVLNLGHTFGHAVEISFGYSHSEAVLKGLLFSLSWSLERGYLKKPLYEKLIKFVSTSLPKISEAQLKKNIMRDKKIKSKGHLDFVFITARGPRVEPVHIDELCLDYKRQMKNEF